MLGTTVEAAKINPLVFDKGPKVTQATGTKLLQTVTNDEVKSALWSIADKKATSPDGFSSSFYKQSWPIVGDSICEAVKEFLCNGILLKQLNATALVLLPKKTSPETIKEYRPLACCNVLMKLITKILANRLKPVLKDIINPG